MKVFLNSICLLSTFFLASSSAFSAPASSDKPYELTIVLDVAPNKVLTEVFRDQIERELREGLQAALGDLARVKVVRDHPKLADIHARGLGRALDAWKECSNVKTHFVLIDLVANQYEIQARQYDGPSGTASPVVRVERTPDRAFVARTAALLIERDFGFIATFRAWPKAKDAKDQPQNVQLELQGAGFGVPLSRWVKQGDVFAIVQMFDGSRAPRPVDWALVQIQDLPRDDASNGACTGRLFWRFKMPVPEGFGHSHYRCIKLGAIRAPVRVRFLQQKNANPLSSLTVQVRRQGFQGEAPSLFTSFTDSSGNFTTAQPNVQPFDRAAFVTVLSSGKPLALLPLPLVSEEPVVVVVDVKADTDDMLIRRIDSWRTQVNEASLVQVHIFQEIQDLAQKPGASREKIVKRAQDGLKRTQEDYEYLQAEEKELLDDPEIKRLDPKQQEQMKQQEQTLEDLKNGEKELKKFVDKQEKILQEENSPERKAALALFADAELALKKADYGQAIELYQKGLLVIDDPSVRKTLEKLEADWKPRSDAHREARAFIYDKWPDLDTVGLDREMETARKALEECIRVGDKIGPLKLYLASKTHIIHLQKELEGLKPAINVDDEKPAQLIKKIADDLQKLVADTLKFLDKESNKLPKK